MHRPRTAFATLLVTLALAGHGTAQSRAERAEDYLRAYHDLRRFHGAALVIDEGRVLYEGALGRVDLGAAEGPSVETRFRVAELTMPFTAAVILRLEEEGMLEIDAPVARYIEEYPRPQGDRITLHHLLTHSSGLPDYTEAPAVPEEAAVGTLSPAEIVALTWSQPLAFEPGTRFARSSSGYVLLGWIAERVTGRPYAELLRRWILDPLALDDTGHDSAVPSPAGHATVFARDLTGYVPAPAADPSPPHAAGMLHSTVGDLRDWMSGLLGWEDAAAPFERAETAERMLTPHAGEYGYGLFVRTLDIGREARVRVVEHGGRGAGFSAHLRAFPDHHRLIVLLDNTGSELEPIVEGFTNLLWGGRAEPPKPSIAERILPIVEAAGVEPALERYRNWRRTRPDEYDYGPDQLRILARHFYEKADTATAIEILEAQLEDDPELPRTRCALSELHAERGDTTRAVAHLEAALTYRPGLPAILERLATLGAEPDPALVAPVVAVEPAALDGLTGSYRIDPSTRLTVELEGGELIARRTGEPAFRLLPQSETAFLLHGSTVRLVFSVQDGRAAAVSVLESGQRATFPRVEEPG